MAGIETSLPSLRMVSNVMRGKIPCATKMETHRRMRIASILADEVSKGAARETQRFDVRARTRSKPCLSKQMGTSAAERVHMGYYVIYDKRTHSMHTHSRRKYSIVRKLILYTHSRSRPRGVLCHV